MRFDRFLRGGRAAAVARTVLNSDSLGSLWVGIPNVLAEAVIISLTRVGFLYCSHFLRVRVGRAIFNTWVPSVSGQDPWGCSRHNSSWVSGEISGECRRISGRNDSDNTLHFIPLKNVRKTFGPIWLPRFTGAGKNMRAGYGSATRPKVLKLAEMFGSNSWWPVIRIQQAASLGDPGFAFP